MLKIILKKEKFFQYLLTIDYKFQSSLALKTNPIKLNNININNTISEVLEIYPDIYSNALDILATVRYIPFRSNEIIRNANEHKELFSNDVNQVRKHSGSFIRQLNLEEEQETKAYEDYNESIKGLCKIGNGTGLKYVQKIMLQWYDPFCEAIVAEIKLVKMKGLTKDRKDYGPAIMLLPIEKLAIITLDTTINSLLTKGNEGLFVGQLAVKIGDLIENEVNLMKLVSVKEKYKPYEQKIISNATSDKKYSLKITKKLVELLETDQWTKPMKVRIGAKLLSLLLDTAKIDGNKSAFVHKLQYNSITKHRYGMIKLDDEFYMTLLHRDVTQIIPRYLPMLVLPKLWNNYKKKYSVYYRLSSELVRTYSKNHREAVRRANIKPVLEGLDYLGSIPWVINKKIYEIVVEAWKRKLTVGEIPIQHDLNIPSKEEILNEYYSNIKNNNNNNNIHNKENFEEILYNEQIKRIKLRNNELHSLRCDFTIKISIAEKFLDDVMYFPWNLDFRGRAYPIPPNLSHLGSDLCRGLLKFSRPKKLGKSGLNWLKIHLANLYGNNKISLDDRIKWVDENMDNIYDSANNPLDGKLWWNNADEPFQALATCIEIVEALKCDNPEEFLCNLPVHQDGSCNGLQHYAALGRDELGGAAVNLLPSDKPQDVYSKVLEIVKRKLAYDCDELPDIPENEKIKRPARLVRDIVDRKVIKQTVMTSVYGVTYIGAREQVRNRLNDKLISDLSLIATHEQEKEIFEASGYLAKLTLSSLTEMFSSAKNIMDWLGETASTVAKQGQVMSWITPLGFPVIQPYRRTKSLLVSSSLQTISLSIDDDALPVSKSKQKSAFSPNFVHSLDATHMLITCINMKKHGLTFAAVHDSFWTHACDIPAMSEILRDSFIELYEKPILEDLRESFRCRYPDAEFPELPARGNLDIKQTKNSRYFFH